MHAVSTGGAPFSDPRDVGKQMTAAASLPDKRSDIAVLGQVKRRI
jgi:hypothetical protein